MQSWLTRAAAVVLTLPAATMAADTYKLDPGHTYPNFRVSHLGFSVMSGQFNETAGTFVVDREGDGSSVEVTIQADSIDTGLDKRDEHLRGGDFFDVANHPEITYQSTAVTLNDDATATVNGELTLLGETHPVTLRIDHMKCGASPINDNQVCGFNATAMLKRSDFGMTNYLPGIGDEIDIRLEAEGVRQ